MRGVSPVWELVPPALTGLLMALLAALWLAANRPRAGAARFAAGLAIVSILGMTPFLLSKGRGIFQFSPVTGFVHYGFVEYVLQFGRVNPAVEGYFMAAPSAWVFHAIIASVTGITGGQTLISWTPTVAYVELAITVYWVVRAMTRGRALEAGVVGLVYFVLANIGGLLTFQASTGAIVIYLCAIGVLCRLDSGNRRDEPVGILLLMILMTALPWQHPLVAILLLMVVGVEALFGGRPPVITVAAGVCALAVWLMYFASAALGALGPIWLETALQFARAFILAARRAEVGSELHSMIFANKVMSALLSFFAAVIAAAVLWKNGAARLTHGKPLRIAATTMFHGLAMGGLFHPELAIRTFVLILAPLGALVEGAATVGRKWALIVFTVIVIGVPYRMVAEFGAPANLLVWTDVSAGQFLRDATLGGVIVQGPFPKSGGYVRDPTKYEPGSYEEVLSGEWKKITVEGRGAEWAYIVFDRISLIDYVYERGRRSMYEQASAWTKDTIGIEGIYANGGARIYFVQTRRRM